MTIFRIHLHKKEKSSLQQSVFLYMSTQLLIPLISNPVLQSILQMRTASLSVYLQLSRLTKLSSQEKIKIFMMSSNSNFLFSVLLLYTVRPNIGNYFYYKL